MNLLAPAGPGPDRGPAEGPRRSARGPSRVTDQMLVSVIIPNYNYERYVGAAIESALGLDWAAVEVIVVDDGSTDGSRAVIERYRDRVQIIHKTNGGQTDACNVGFAACRGDLAIFLDSDDILSPSLMREVAAIWRPDVVKVQCQMSTIDASGAAIGSVFPSYRMRPTPDKVFHWAKSSGAYPTPPGSGNVYSAKLLRTIFPLDGTESASDSYLLAAAPFLGAVETIARPLVYYRIHGLNDGALTGADPSKFAREVTRAAWRFRYSQTIARRSKTTIPDRAFHRSMTTLAYRLASFRLAREGHPVPGDRLGRILVDFVAAFFAPQGLSLVGRSALLAWAFGVATFPRRLADRLIEWRFASSKRPRRLRRWLSLLGIGR